MGWFDAFREGDANTYYESQRTPVTIDVTQILVLFFSLVIATALCILVIGSRGRERWTTLLRLIFSLHTCVVIFISIFGGGWQTGSVVSQCRYTYTYHQDIELHIGLNLGLKDINITLSGEINATGLMGRIDYNERLSIDKVTDMKEEYDVQLARGLPSPILSVAEYFREDSGGLRWMRQIHDAGHFTFIMLWCSFVLWIMGNTLIGFVVSRGALFVTLSGISLVMSCVVYATLQPPSLIIPLGGKFLTVSYGWCFYLCITSGVVTTCSGVAVLIALVCAPLPTSLLFLVDTSSLSDSTDPDRSMSYDGPLQIKSVYTERRQSLQHLPYNYSNPAFGYNRGAVVLQKRSFSFDFGNMTSPLQTLGALSMTSITENDDSLLNNTKPPLLHHNNPMDQSQHRRHTPLDQPQQNRHSKYNFEKITDKCTPDNTRVDKDRIAEFSIGDKFNLANTTIRVDD